MMKLGQIIPRPAEDSHVPNVSQVETETRKPKHHLFDVADQYFEDGSHLKELNSILENTNIAFLGAEHPDLTLREFFGAILTDISSPHGTLRLLYDQYLKGNKPSIKELRKALSKPELPLAEVFAHENFDYEFDELNQALVIKSRLSPKEVIKIGQTRPNLLIPTVPGKALGLFYWQDKTEPRAKVSLTIESMPKDKELPDTKYVLNRIGLEPYEKVVKQAKEKV